MGEGVQIINGDCKNISLINLLQPNWICTNNVQDKLNMQRYVNAKEDFVLFFLCKKSFNLSLINKSRLNLNWLRKGIIF